MDFFGNIVYDVRHLRNNFYCEAVMIQGNLRTKFFASHTFPYPRLLDLELGGRRAMMVVQTFYLKPSCEFRSILIMLDFGQGKLNPQMQKRSWRIFFSPDKFVLRKLLPFVIMLGFCKTFQLPWHNWMKMLVCLRRYCPY